MAVSGRRKFDDDKVVKYETAEKDFEVEVSRTLNKWCVTVYQLPDRQILVQDFFPERWKALARAQDFIRLLNQRKKKEEEGSTAGDVVGIAHRHDACQQGNLVTGQPVRISRPVVALVVMADHRSQVCAALFISRDPTLG